MKNLEKEVEVQNEELTPITNDELENTEGGRISFLVQWGVDIFELYYYGPFSV